MNVIKMFGVDFVIYSLLSVASSVDEVYVPMEHSPVWAYVLICVAAAALVVGAAVFISKKIK